MSRRVIVTGAASGIGLATARAFAAANDIVMGIDVAPAPADVECLRADLGDVGEVHAAVAEIAARGRVDALINVAGVEYDAALGAIDVEKLDRMIAINFRGPILMAQAALDKFSSRRGH